jgi:spore coat polysaccharide biosynthesis protein SpsF
LEEAWELASKNYEWEHTTPYIWERPDTYRIGNVEWEIGLDYSMSHRFTIDYKEDYHFIRRVYDELWTANNPIFSLKDILNLLQEKKDIFDINAKYAGVNWYHNYIGELKTIAKDQTRSPAIVYTN